MAPPRRRACHSVFMAYATETGSGSTLGSVNTCESVSGGTTAARSNLLPQIVLGHLSRFNFSKLVPPHDGWNISSRDPVEREIDGFGRMLLTSDYGGATRRREGSSRESTKDYLHFLYIARGSLSETQYFVHLARRLGYLSPHDADALHGQTKLAFACLHGLINAVEKDVGKVTKIVATITSLFVIGLARWPGQLSVVS